MEPAGRTISNDDTFHFQNNVKAWQENAQKVSEELSSLTNIQRDKDYAYERTSGYFTEIKNVPTLLQRIGITSRPPIDSHLLEGALIINAHTLKLLRQARNLLSDPRLDPGLCKEMQETLKGVHAKIIAAMPGAYRIAKKDSNKEVLTDKLSTIFETMQNNIHKTYQKMNERQASLSQPQKKINSTSDRLPFINQPSERQINVNNTYVKNMKNALEYVENHLDDWTRELAASRQKRIKHKFSVDPTNPLLKWTAVIHDNGSIYLHTHERINDVKKGKYKTDKLAFNDEDISIAKLSSKPKTIAQSQEFDAEVEFLKKLKGESNVVQLDHVYVKEIAGNYSKTTLYLEYYKNLTLTENIKKLNDAQRISISLDIITGLKSCHTKGRFAQLDLKCDNILIDENMRAYIADFGLSKSFGKLVNPEHGNYQAMAPELINSRVLASPALDIWSAGVIIHFLLSGKYPPWVEKASTVEELKRNLFDVEYFKEPSDPWLRVCWEMCQRDPNKRISLGQAYQKFSALQASQTKLPEIP
jgi:hypothetical protein